MRLTERIERLTSRLLDRLTRVRIHDVRRRLAEEPSTVTDEDLDFLAMEVGWRAYLAPDDITGEEWAVWVRRRGAAWDWEPEEIEEAARCMSTMPGNDRLRLVRSITANAEADGHTRESVMREREAWQRRIFAPG